MGKINNVHRNARRLPEEVRLSIPRATKLATEIGERLAAVQTARLAAAEYQRELEMLALGNAGNLQNAAGRGRAAMDAVLAPTRRSRRQFSRGA